jgi:hypothetical protein
MLKFDTTNIIVFLLLCDVIIPLDYERCTFEVVCVIIVELLLATERLETVSLLVKLWQCQLPTFVGAESNCCCTWFVIELLINSEERVKEAFYKIFFSV